MNKTPQKIVDGDKRCFLCNSAPPTNQRVKIFGKTKVDIKGLIKTAIDIDVNLYSSGNVLFVCSMTCYKRLIRLDKTIKNLEDAKEEIRKDFARNGNLIRAKRMQNSDENLGDRLIQSEQRQRTSASKSLNFVNPSTNCASSGVSLGLYLPQSQCHHRYQVGFNEFGSLSLTRGHTNVNQFASHDVYTSTYPNTSSPIPSKVSSRISPTIETVSPLKSTKVNVSIEYPSKTFNKQMPSEYEAIGKALVHGTPKRIANAVMKCKSISKFIVENVLRTVSTEVNLLCSRKNPSLLRKTGKQDLMKYSMQTLCLEWQTRSPVFYAFLMTVALSRNKQSHLWLPSVALAGSILLKQRNSHMSATGAVIGILLKTGSIEVNNISILMVAILRKNQ